MTVPIPVEWRCDVDQESAVIRDLLDKQPNLVYELRKQTDTGRIMASWGITIAANILNAADDHGAAMRAYAWIETLESFR